jgi:hypothetical protein
MIVPQSETVPMTRKSGLIGPRPSPWKYEVARSGDFVA